MILARFSAQGLAVVFTTLLARRLGTAEFGAYAFIAAILFVVNALTTFGTDMLLIREIAAKDELSGLPAALILQLALSAMFLAMVWSLGVWIPNQSQETIVALKVYSLALIPLAFFTIFTTALRGKQLMDGYALLNVIVSLLQVGVVLILHEDNLILLSFFLVLAQLLAALFAGFLCSFLIPQFWRSWHFSYSSLSALVKTTAPIATLTVLGMLYQRLGVTVLSLMSSPDETGIFSAAARIVEASKTAHLGIFVALYPAMAASATLLQTIQPKRNQRYSRSTVIGLLLMGAMLISLFLFIFASPLVKLLFGNGFIASASILQILTWSLVPFTVNTYFTLSFLVSKQEHVVGRTLMISLLGLLILNLWWIPARGPEGAAWASLIAECLQSVFLLASAPSRNFVKGEAHELSHLP